MNHLPPQLRLSRRPAEPPAANGEAPRLAPREKPGRERSLRKTWRQLRQPLPLIGAGLIVVAISGYVLVAKQAHAQSEVVVATQNLPAGTVLRLDDLQTTKLTAAAAIVAKLIPGPEEASLVGRRLAAPVIAGLPLPQASVAGAGGGPAAFTLAVGELHALAGELQPGDRVTVVATFTAANGTSSARVIARGLVVLAVGQAPVGLDPASTTIPVTVALPEPTIATELALANNAGKIDLLRDGGNTSARVPTVSAGAGT